MVSRTASPRPLVGCLIAACLLAGGAVFAANFNEPVTGWLVMFPLGTEPYELGLPPMSGRLPQAGRYVDVVEVKGSAGRRSKGVLVHHALIASVDHGQPGANEQGGSVTLVLGVTAHQAEILNRAKERDGSALTVEMLPEKKSKAPAHKSKTVIASNPL